MTPDVVFLVTSKGRVDGGRVEGIFSTKDAADRCAVDQSHSHPLYVYKVAKYQVQRQYAATFLRNEREFGS